MFKKYPKIPKEYSKTFTYFQDLDYSTIKFDTIRFSTLNSVLICSNSSRNAFYGLYQTLKGRFFVLVIEDAYPTGFNILPKSKKDAELWAMSSLSWENWIDVRAAFFDEPIEIA